MLCFFHHVTAAQRPASLTLELDLEELREDAVGRELVQHAAQELPRDAHAVPRDDQAASATSTESDSVQIAQMRPSLLN